MNETIKEAVLALADTNPGCARELLMALRIQPNDLVYWVDHPREKRTKDSKKGKVKKIRQGDVLVKWNDGTEEWVSPGHLNPY